MKTSVYDSSFRSLAIRKIGLLSLALCFPGAAHYAEAATIKWNVNSGDWADSASWSPNAPVAADRVDFEVNAGSSDSTAYVNVAAGANHTAGSAYVGYGKDVEITLGEGSKLNLAALNVGLRTPSTIPFAKSGLKVVSTGAAEFNVNGIITVGADVNTSVGNKLEFSGPDLKVTATSLSMGRYKEGNQFTISNGAQLKLGSQVWIGATQAVASGTGNDNKMVITGAGSRLEITTPNSLPFLVASRDNGGATNPQKGNIVEISDGGTVFIDNTGGVSRSGVLIGAQQYKNSNRITVDGVGSSMELKGNIGIDIGYSGSQTWNNYLEVKNGGVVRNEGNFTIRGNRGSGPNNRLVVDNGSYISGSSIDVVGGDIQVINGGRLLARNWDGSDGVLNISIANSTSTVSRFLIGAGSEVSAGVNATINAGAVFALTSGGSSVGTSAFTLNSDFTLKSGAIFETSIFGGGVDDIYHIDLASTGSLSLEGDVALKLTLAGYTVVGGESWQLFTGNIEDVTGSFNVSLSTLPSLADGMEWDLSRFNTSGGWVIGVTAIPEPSTYAFIGFGLVACAFAAHRRGRAAKAGRQELASL